MPITWRYVKIILIAYYPTPSRVTSPEWVLINTWCLNKVKYLVSKGVNVTFIKAILICGIRKPHFELLAAN